MMKKWMIILRAYSWPASLVPVVLGSVVASRQGAFSWLDFCLTFIAALAVHSAANLANTYYDFRNGVDRKETADDRGLVDGLITPRAMLQTALGLFAGGAAIGLLLVYKNHVPALLWLGATGFALAWFYTATGFAYKYRALGDIGIFFAFGPFIVSGTALIQARQFLPEALWASIPVGLLIVGILHANNMRDVRGDTEAKFSTLASILGAGGAKRLYFFLILTPYLFALTFGSIWPVILCALSAPQAVKLCKMASKGDFSALVPETAKLVAIFGLLLSAGLYFSA
ncbi:MAG: 1,4-dihydroxy-2-naphthoate octaprenyltransferase [Elusimicrobia bacterium GWC2_64_44]|nr:MAG: 1,4-dihydroxy-2-naphthoate octaprenyltransferase [Elusimicrobia bacterium GWC2_64_44]